MTKSTLILLLLIWTKVCICQKLILTGTIAGTAKKDIGATKNDIVEVNESYDGNYWKKNSVYLKPDAAGNFRVSYPCNGSKFILLLYKENKQWVMLSPGRPLHVDIMADRALDGKVDRRRQLFSFSGAAKPENDLIQKLQMEAAEDLPFIKELKLKNSYAAWSVDSVIKYKLPDIMRSLDSARQLIGQAALPPAIKKRIVTEIKYFYAGAVAENLGSFLNRPEKRNDFNTHFIDTVLSDFSLPSEEELNTGVHANSYLDIYFRFELWKTVYAFGTNRDKGQADSIFKSATGVTFKELANDPDRQNESYLFSTRLRGLLPRYAWEKHLANLLFGFCMSGQLQSAAKLFNFMKANCSNRLYITASEKMVAPLKKARDQYAGNLNIKIRPDYRSISSLKTLLAPYKGKVVFMDMWGTWCPHCIEDMVFEPALKDRLKDRDIVFLYIARDEDKDDEVWRDFIFINNLTGEHVRRTADQIAPLWNELGIADSDQAYPHYFIFDRTGNIMVSDAKRPGGGDALYLQLETALKK